MMMEIVKEEGRKPEPVTKGMNTMARGEVCYFEDKKQYIFKISSIFGNENMTPIFLILNNTTELLYHNSDQASECKVRELYPDESVTIKFS